MFLLMATLCAKPAQQVHSCVSGLHATTHSPPPTPHHIHTLTSATVNKISWILMLPHPLSLPAILLILCQDDGAINTVQFNMASRIKNQLRSLIFFLIFFLPQVRRIPRTRFWKQMFAQLRRGFRSQNQTKADCLDAACLARAHTHTSFKVSLFA